MGKHVVCDARFIRPRSVTVLAPTPESIVLLHRNLKKEAVNNADLSKIGIGVSEMPAEYDNVCNNVFAVNFMIEPAHD